MDCNLSIIVKSEGVLKVVGIQVHMHRSDSVSKTVLKCCINRLLTGSDISKISNCDDLGCIYFKVICRLQCNVS